MMDSMDGEIRHLSWIDSSIYNGKLKGGEIYVDKAVIIMIGRNNYIKMSTQ
jgi:hypothetical protein